MNEPARIQRNRKMISECDPWFAPKIEAVIRDLEGHDQRPRIQQAWRDPAEQLQDFLAKKSKLKFGFHCITRNAGGHNVPAALACDVLDDNNPQSPSQRFLFLLAASAQAHGLVTGIEWGLAPADRIKIRKVLQAHDWDQRLEKIGWDPCHVEPKGLSVKKARAGIRP